MLYGPYWIEYCFWFMLYRKLSGLFFGDWSCSFFSLVIIESSIRPMRFATCNFLLYRLCSVSSQQSRHKCQYATNHCTCSTVIPILQTSLYVRLSQGEVVFRKGEMIETFVCIQQDLEWITNYRDLDVMFYRLCCCYELWFIKTRHRQIST